MCDEPKSLGNVPPTSPVPAIISNSVTSNTTTSSNQQLVPAISTGHLQNAANVSFPPPEPSVIQMSKSTSSTDRAAPLSNHLNSSSMMPNTAPFPTASTSSLGAAAFANPFLVSVSSQASASLPETSASYFPPNKTSSSADVATGLPQPSPTSRRPNLACPSDTPGGSDSSIKSSDPMAELACNPDTTTATDFSSTMNSTVTSGVAGTAGRDPSKGGTYLMANATSDQKSHCLNIAAHQYQVCWEVLNVTGYLQDWMAYNSPKCNNEDMGFADCFLYLEVGSGANCTSFTGRSQCPSPDTRAFQGRVNGAQTYYVAFNIWNLQNFFFTYYMAIGGANGLTIDNVESIVRTLNLPTPKTFNVLDLLAGLAWAFGLLSPSGYAAAIPKLGEKVTGFAAQSPGEYLLRAIQNAPTLSRNLLATGSLSDSDVQVAELGSGLARIVSQLENNVQNSIILVMSNFSIFFDFVEDGFFSTQIDNLNTITQNVTLSLNTYIVSQALQNDDVIITRALDTDVNELQLNGSAVNYDTGCGYGYDEWGMCGSWWYDSANHVSYGLESLKDMLNNYTDPLQSIFNQGITTPELLFMNSQFCADAAGSTQGSAPGTSLTTDTGIWNTECISNMKICTWDTVNMGTNVEFTDCNREGAWAGADCGAALELVQMTVPASYLGPYLTSPLFQGVVCNKWSKGMGNPG